MGGAGRGPRDLPDLLEREPAPHMGHDHLPLIEGQPLQLGFGDGRVEPASGRFGTGGARNQLLEEAACVSWRRRRRAATAALIAPFRTARNSQAAGLSGGLFCCTKFRKASCTTSSAASDHCRGRVPEPPRAGRSAGPVGRSPCPDRPVRESFPSLLTLMTTLGPVHPRGMAENRARDRPSPRISRKSGVGMTPARKIGPLTLMSPIRRRGSIVGTLSGAAGWYQILRKSRKPSPGRAGCDRSRISSRRPRAQEPDSHQIRLGRFSGLTTEVRPHSHASNHKLTEYAFTGRG